MEADETREARASVTFNPLILCDSLLVGEHRIGAQIRYLGEVLIECKCVTRKDCAPGNDLISRGPRQKKNATPYEEVIDRGKSRGSDVRGT